MLNVAKHLFLARLIINNDFGEATRDLSLNVPVSLFLARGWALGIISLWLMNLWQFVYKSDDLFAFYLFFFFCWTC